nr:MAG TPA: hypothetical protein [Caudoviricetes sp.]
MEHEGKIRSRRSTYNAEKAYSSSLIRSKPIELKESLRLSEA